MPNRRNYGKDREVRIILGVLFVLVGLGGSSMSSMMGFGYSMFGWYGNLVSLGLVILGVYLIYDGFRD